MMRQARISTLKTDETDVGVSVGSAILQKDARPRELLHS
jgi:hypothetical protein